MGARKRRGNYERREKSDRRVVRKTGSYRIEKNDKELRRERRGKKGGGRARESVGRKRKDQGDGSMRERGRGRRQ